MMLIGLCDSVIIHKEMENIQVVRYLPMSVCILPNMPARSLQMTYSIIERQMTF